MIECLRCKKKYDDSVKKCQNCGNEFDDLYKINYYNNILEKYNKKIGLEILWTFIVIVIPILWEIFENGEDFKKAFGEDVIPNAFWVIYGIIGVIILGSIYIYFRSKRTKFRRMRDAIITDEYEICDMCGFYKKKNEECKAAHNIR